MLIGRPGRANFLVDVPLSNLRIFNGERTSEHTRRALMADILILLADFYVPTVILASPVPFVEKAPSDVSSIFLEGS